MKPTLKVKTVKNVVNYDVEISIDCGSYYIHTNANSKALVCEFLKDQSVEYSFSLVNKKSYIVPESYIFYRMRFIDNLSKWVKQKGLSINTDVRP